MVTIIREAPTTPHFLELLPFSVLASRDLFFFFFPRVKRDAAIHTERKSNDK